MAMEDAKRYARRARKLAPETMYEFARSIEKAIDEIAKEIDALKKKPASPEGGVNAARTSARSSSWS